MTLGRIPYHIVVILSALLAGPCLLRAQTNIGGVVNQYVAVIDVIPCDSTVVVGNPSGFNAGDLVLLIQVLGARIAKNNDSTFGGIDDIGSAGNCEFLTIRNVNGDRVTFTTRMANRYASDGGVQLIKVPRYASARVVATLKAPPWNGTIGGVVAISVDGDLRLEADIDVSGLGFAGGATSTTNTAIGIQGYIHNWVLGVSGMKGDGIARNAWPYPIGGSGRFANGGGGGNGHNAGGGGGSNGGQGGPGGWALYASEEQMKSAGGLPGVVLDTLAKSGRVFLGGGGGGPHQNDNKGTPGGAGGGIVVIRAKTLVGNGFSVLSNGVSTLPSASEEPGDGTGGGGAGGSIVLLVDSVRTALNVEAKGGGSGDIHSLYSPHGTGGGGGGGVVYLPKPLTGFLVDVSGGKNGVNLGTKHGFTGSTFGSEPGDYGVVITDFTWKTPLSIGLATWGGGPFCGTDSVQVSATPGFATYQWSNGATTQIISVNTPGDYSVVATDPSGCVHQSGPVCVWENSPQYNLAGSIDFGKVDYKRSYIRTIALRNTDDEDITVSRITSTADFTVIAPIAYPVVIPAGDSLDISVRLFTDRIADYHDTLRVVISRPCPDTGTIVLDAIINVVKARYSFPDTSALVGSTGFGMPLRVRLDPDTLVLPATQLVVKASFDSRVFSPSLVTHGRLTGDVIDVIANRRSVTITFDSVDLIGPEMTLTSIVGTVLNSYITETPFTIDSIEYVKVFQYPLNYTKDGLLVVSPVCFQRGRQIKLYGFPAASITPNPASDVVQMDVELSLPGTYSITFTNELGQQIDTFSYEKTGDATESRSELIDVMRWPSGVYHVVFVCPSLTSSTNLIINR